jgi:hypothetical protein
MDAQVSWAEEAREILVRRHYGERFDPMKLKRLVTHLARRLLCIGTCWKFTRSVLTGEELQIEKFSLKERLPSRWMIPKPKPKKRSRQGRRSS